MGISANSLFHFTSTKDNLLSILENYFWPHYSLNGIKSLKDKKIDRSYPMVSFCDIPLSQIKGHIKIYGDYAIGLSKEWGIENKVCPVLYYYKNSSFWDGMREIIDNIRSYNESYEQLKVGALTITVYRKLYEGYLFRNYENDYLDEKIRFYDEREWRYVPPVTELRKEKIAVLLSKKQENISKIETYEDKMKKKFRLKFSPKDVKYIIVRDDDEILELSESLGHIKGSDYLHNDIKLLTSRLISIKQVLEDF